MGELFKNKVFTTAEQDYCESKLSPSMHYAGRFFAKESIIKAVKSSGYKNPIPFKDIEILSSDSGAPIVNLHFILEWECKVSISHTEFYAIASALYIQKMKLLTNMQAKMLDRIALKKHNKTGQSLMKNAGRCVSDLAISLLKKVQNPKILIVICGKGNNRGDGFKLHQFSKITIIILPFIR